MGWEVIGTIGSIVSVIAATAFVIGYATLAPWYRSDIGRSLMISKTWICGVAWYAMLRAVLDPESNNAFLVLRAVVWLALPIVSCYTLWALLIKVQVRSHRKRSRKARPKEEIG